MSMVPCLHRIHLDQPDGALAIHQSLGLSIAYMPLIERLEQLNQNAERSGQPARSVLVTFDDGWADVMRLAPQFSWWSYLRPVLFLTLVQLAGKRPLMPMPRLYHWCASTDVALSDLPTYDVSRADLKRIPEAAQHLVLDRIGVPRVTDSPEILAEQQIRELMSQGWLVGSHGYEHFDLRRANDKDLAYGLERAYEAVLQFGGVPWLAWPEGRCSARSCEVAASVGFELQFSLQVEAGSLSRRDLIHREIWK